MVVVVVVVAVAVGGEGSLASSLSHCLASLLMLLIRTCPSFILDNLASPNPNLTRTLT